MNTIINGGRGYSTNFGLTITLLAGISAILITIVNYFNSTIIDLTDSAILAVYFIFFCLFLEIIILVFSLLTGGYLTLENNKKKHDFVYKFYIPLHKLAFLFPLCVLFCSFLLSVYFLLTKLFEVSEAVNVVSVSLILLITLIILSYFWLDIDIKDFKMVLSDIMIDISSIKDIKNWIHDKDSARQAIKDIFYGQIISSVISIILFFLLIFGLILVPSFLLCGSYSIEIIQNPDSKTDIMCLAIKDTGVPSPKCYITLYEVDSLNDGFFQEVDNLTLRESVKEQSTHNIMTGIKKDGIYYLQINNSYLLFDSYLLHAEVTYNENFELLKVRKFDNIWIHTIHKNNL